MRWHALVEGLLKPEAYPENTTHVAMEQTHISAVFLTDQYAYKLKKPVRLGFLDYSTLERRKFFCDREVALNRDLAPDLYLGVVAVSDDPTSGVNLAGKGKTVDYVVKMKRLRMTGRRMLQTGALQPEMIRQIARQVYAFHAKKAPLPISSTYGSPQQVEGIWRMNFVEASEFASRWEPQAFAEVQGFVAGFLAKHAPLFHQRKEDLGIRPCHGDLRLDNLGLLDHHLEIFDCIEFNEDFRFMDVAAEVAFLAMDLDFERRIDLGREWILTYGRLARSPSLLAVLPFYKCYRAFVRGKVESIRAREIEIPEAMRSQATLLARTYFRLAQLYARMTTQKQILIFCGMVASGKSTLAGELGKVLGAPVLSSDRIRKELAGIPEGQPAATEFEKGLYTPEHTQRTYQAILDRAQNGIAQTSWVILDATYARASDRRRLIEWAHSHNAEFLFVECCVSEDVAHQRLLAREEEKSPISDARLPHYGALKRRYEPLTEIDSGHRIVVTSTNEKKDILTEIMLTLYLQREKLLMEIWHKERLHV